jgi:U4/U6 small nuclear ribonucleoprotein PRP31
MIMIISVSASTTPGAPLSEEELQHCRRGCEEILKLDKDRSVLLKFVESRMSKIAPNLCALIGAHVAAQLVGLAGGLIALSKIPSCNVQVMGQQRKNLAGLSMASANQHVGILTYCSLVQSCPPALRKKALKIVAGKVALAVRVDCYQTSFDGSQGERLREEVESRLEKEQGPQTARTKKALPIPEEKKGPKRGGKRARKLKERFAVTDLQKAQNKMTFTLDGGEYGDSAMGMDQGMVGSKDSGRLRAPVAKESKIPHKLKKVSVASAQSGGMASSLAFTTVQGMELVNPNAAAERVRAANNKWFNSQSGFLSAAPK